MVGADLSKLEVLSAIPVTSRLALIAGTSSCHMAVSRVYSVPSHVRGNLFILDTLGQIEVVASFKTLLFIIL